MNAIKTETGKVHHGKNIKRFREMLGMKQEALAIELGKDWTQKRVSLLESRENIESPLLSVVAKALKVPEDALKTFDDESAINIISNTFTNGDNSTSIALFGQPSFNVIDKLVELYERLLTSEREKTEFFRSKVNQ